MQIILHDTKTCYTKVLQVDHSLKPQEVITGDGRGTYTIESGHPIIYKTVLEIIKLDIVWRVVVGVNYFMITVSNPARWKEIENILPGLVVRNLENE